MISQRKRTRIMRKNIRERLDDAEMWFGTSQFKYDTISLFLDIHEKVLEDITSIGLLRDSRKRLAEKMNDDRYSEEAKELMYHRYCWIIIDIQELLI